MLKTVESRQADSGQAPLVFAYTRPKPEPARMAGMKKRQSVEGDTAFEGVFSTYRQA